jgi:hypothetical protein
MKPTGTATRTKSTLLRAADASSGPCWKTAPFESSGAVLCSDDGNKNTASWLSTNPYIHSIIHPSIHPSILPSSIYPQTAAPIYFGRPRTHDAAEASPLPARPARVGDRHRRCRAPRQRLSSLCALPLPLTPCLPLFCACTPGAPCAVEPGLESLTAARPLFISPPRCAVHRTLPPSSLPLPADNSQRSAHLHRPLCANHRPWPPPCPSSPSPSHRSTPQALHSLPRFSESPTLFCTAPPLTTSTHSVI